MNLKWLDNPDKLIKIVITWFILINSSKVIKKYIYVFKCQILAALDSCSTV